MASQGRLPLIGVIGGEDQTGCSRLVGRQLIKNGCVVLTGGCAIGDKSVTKNEAIMGTLDAERYGEGISRYIGILPNGKSSDLSFERVSQRQILCHSGLSSMQRNPLNGITPDVLVCFPGGPGTISELGFGILAGREAVFYSNAAEILLRTCTGKNAKEIERCILRVVEDWKSHPKFPTNKSNKIMHIVTEYLTKAVDRPKLMSAEEIVYAALQMLPERLPKVPIFLGVPNDRIQKQIDEFVICWNALSDSNIEN